MLIILLSISFSNNPIVDENLFYKGVDKTKVHGARLHQVHSLADPDVSPPAVIEGNQGSATGNVDEKEYNEHPPYPFDTGNSLLALTKKHNVRLA